MLTRNTLIMAMGAVVACAAVFGLFYGGAPDVAGLKEPAPLPPQYLVESDVAALRRAVAAMRTDVNTCAAKVAALETKLAKPEPLTTGSISKPSKK